MSSSKRSSTNSSGRKTLLGVRGFASSSEAEEAVRLRFLLAIQEHAPEVLLNLKRSVGRRGGDAVRSEALDWASRWGLTCDGKIPNWLWDQVEATLEAWQASKDESVGDRWMGSVGEHIQPVLRFGRVPAPLEAVTEVVTVTSNIGDTQVYVQELSCVWGSATTEQDICDALLELSRRCIAAAQSLDLRKYCDDSKYCDDKGYAKTLKYAKTRKKDRDHFRWAVEYQCLGRKVAVIAKSALQEQTVDVAIRDVLRLVGLTRRGKPGRPRNP